MKDQFEVTISYRKACIAKNTAIQMAFGTWDDSYKQLPFFMEAMKYYNPGTIVKYVITSTDVPGTHIFEGMFWALSGCIKGFKYCRPVITIDATFLKGKYKGVVMVANGVDANGQIFPLAFALMDGESKRAWGYFLTKLRKYVAKSRTDICLISDRGGGILAAVNDSRNGWGPDYGVVHVFCIRHIQGNLIDTLSENKTAIADLMMIAATQHQVSKFEVKMELIKAMDPGAEKWLRQIPLHQWTLSHDGGRRFGIITSNLVESFNNALLGARALPVSALAESIYFRVNKYFTERHHLATNLCNSGSMVTPQVHDRINKWKNKAGTHGVIGHDYERGIFTVTSGYHGVGGGKIQVVNLEEHTCSCGKWVIYGHPCSHVIAVCQHRGIDWMQFVPEWFHVAQWVKIYSHTIMPIHARAYWPPPTWDWTFIPNSTMLRSRGRAQNRRIRSHMDHKKKRVAKCGLCDSEQHDRRTCPSGSSSRGHAPIL